jgi:hypothetical protein
MGEKTKTKERVVERERTEKTVKPEVVEEEYQVTVCDYCGQEFPDLEPDDLNTLKINPPEESRELEETVQIPMESSFNEKIEVYRAVMNSELITTTRKRVMETEPVFSDPSEVDVPKSMSFDSDISDELIAYQFTVRALPKRKAEIEMGVCDHCKRAFWGAKQTSNNES